MCSTRTCLTDLGSAVKKINDIGALFHWGSRMDPLFLGKS